MSIIKLMLKVNQKGIAHLLLLVILALGLGAGFLLVNNYGTQFINKAAPKIPDKPETSFELELKKSVDSPFDDNNIPTSIAPGSTFRVDLYVRSDIDEANLFTAKVKYSTDTLDFVEINKREGQSFIKSWVETSVENGVINIVGGVPTPGRRTDIRTDGALLMASIVFKAKKVGDTNLEFTEGSAIYRNSDNVNIISAKKGIIFSIKEVIATPSPTDTAQVNCKDVYVAGGIQSKLSSGEIVYIVESEKDVYLKPTVAPPGSKVNWKIISRSNVLEGDGIFDYNNKEDGSWVTYFVPRNSTDKVESIILGSDVASTEGKINSCPNIILSVQPGRTSSTYSFPCEIYGDLNLDGKITNDDAEIVLKIEAGVIKIQNSVVSGDTQYMRVVGDVTGDEKIDGLDALIIKKFVAGEMTTFPICQKSKQSPCNGIGDVSSNGMVTPFDTYEVLRLNLKYNNSLYTGRPYTEEQKKRANVVLTDDKDISSLDALRVLRYVAGDDVSFDACPVGDTSEGSGDGNKDSKIDLVDLSMLLSSFGEDKNYKLEIDLDGNGAINSLDFSLMRNLLLANKVIKS